MSKPKRILITGASSGIGRSLALAYAKEGASLVLMGRDAVRLDATAEVCRAAGASGIDAHIADVRDRTAMNSHVEAADKVAPLDVLVANAGVATGLAPGQAFENPDAVRAAFAINVNGVFNTVEPIIPAMTARGAGVIAIVGSMAGVRSLPYSPAYCATKASVHMWADCLRGRLAPHGVHVSLIVPGFVNTPMSQRTKSWQPGIVSDEDAARIIKRGLDRKHNVIAFPQYMYVAQRFFSLLPASLVDGVMRRFHVDVPETAERGES